MVSDFWIFCKAGRDLADLHLHYESLEPYDVTTNYGKLFEREISDPENFYRVKKMMFGTKGKGKDKTKDQRIIIYNENITITDIPLEAYDYKVNGKSAIGWVMDRQSRRKDKDSGIVNDANLYAIETMNDPSYPYKLLLRVVTMSLETMKLINSLPKLDID